jgi:DNA-binding response OmpR family regulator
MQDEAVCFILHPSSFILLEEAYPMLRFSVRLMALLALLALAALAARAQDDKPDPGVEATKRLLKKAEEEYRLFIKRPESVLEYWAAMKFEMQLGKFDLAGLHLKLLLDKYEKQPEEASKDLLKIEAAEGLADILKLRRVKQWSDHPPFQKEAVENVEKLIDRLIEAVEKHLGDPDRIQKFIKRLDAPTAEERAFARLQLMQAGVRAVPYLVESLRVNVGKALYDRVRDLMLEMDSEIVPGYLELFRAANPNEAKELEPRLTLLNLTVQRGDRRIVPYLWHLGASPQYPEPVRKAAREALQAFLKIDVVNLPPAKFALTELANDYYYHRVRFPTKVVRIWPWDGKQLATKPVELTPTQAEEFFGLRFARQALDLDAKYQPAQIALLGLMLERTLEPDLDQLLLKPLPPGLKNLLVTLDPELLGVVLEKTMDDHKVPASVALVQALGERGDPRAARLGADGIPHGLLRALYYPDRRVQFAAAQAALRMHSVPGAASVRVVDIFRRFLGGDPAVPRALALYVPGSQENETRQSLKAAGYDATVVRDVKEAFEKLRASADYDVILVHRGVPAGELPFVLAQLRGDNDVGGLPVLVVSGKEKDEDIAKLARQYRSTQGISLPALAQPDEVKARFDALIKSAQGAKLTVDERKELGRTSLDALWRMARGEYAGYNVRPAEDAIYGALRSPDQAPLALETLSRLPGTELQHRLAGVVLDPARAKLRIPAAHELGRHIQKYGLLLDKKYSNDLKTMFQTADDPTLKGELAVVVGLMRTPTPQQTGVQLFQFRPDVPPPPMEKKDKDEKEK